MTHGNSVIHANGVEFERNAASFTDRFLHDFTEFLKMHMTRNDVDVRVTYGDERFAEILFLNACCTQKARCGARSKPFDHV